MLAPCPLYHTIATRIAATTAPVRLPAPSLRRLALLVVWTIWEQNAPLPDGAYWAMVDAALDRLATLLPAGCTVCIVADRAYAVAPLLDRLTARGWHWVIRITTTGSHRFRDAHGR